MTGDSADDLLNVRDTAQLLGVHENTVRNWVKDGTLSDSRIPGSRFHRFKCADVERLVKQRGKSTPSLQGERQTIGPELVDASQLAAWAANSSRRAQDTFPELMRRLLAATPGITSIFVRAADGVALSGWDGSATSEGAPFLPAGELRFEFGVSRNVKGKADEDWAARTADGGPSSNCFVFATPRRWRDGPAWQVAHAEMGMFADVKVIDADVLDGWLKTTPSVHYWISEELGRRPRDAVTIEEWWRRFASGVKIDIPIDAFMAGRGEQRDRLGAFLRGNARVTTIQSEWSEDGKAFIYAVTRPADDETPPPIVVVSSAEVWDRIVLQPGRVVLIPTFENPAVGTAVNHGHHVLIVVDRLVDSGRAVDIELPRLERTGAAEAFQRAGIDFTLAQRYSAQARRNLPAFIRSLSPDPRIVRPPWAQQPTARILAPLILIGSWTTERDDLEVVERLVGRPWSGIEDTVKAVSLSSDPVFRKVGQHWSLTSPAEAFLLLAPSLNADDVQRWSAEVQTVLLDPDPTLELPLDDRPFAAINGVRRPYSATLRAGLTQGLALMGTYGDRETPDGTISLAESAAEVVRLLLAAANRDAPGHLWHQLSGSLPMIAEAAPQVFVDAIEDDLSSSSPVLVNLFQDQVEGRFQLGPSSPHPYLLWALETVSWSVDFFLDGIRLLAKLAAVDPGGKTKNRPAESLSYILPGWIRHTSAALSERIRALELVIDSDAEVGWTLVMKLWPSNHAFVMPPAAPHIRDWRPNTTSVPMSEWAAFVHVIVAQAIVLAASDAEKLGKLADGISTVATSDQDAIMRSLETAAASGLADPDRLALWELLRKLVAHHQRFSTAAWAMPEATLTRLGAILELLEPQDDPHRFGYLFDWHPDLPDVDQTDFTAYQDKLHELQVAAIATIVAQPEWAQKLSELAARVRVPMHLGWALAERDEAALADVSPWMVAEQGPLREAAAGWVQSKLRLHGAPWLADTLKDLRDDEAARHHVLLQVGARGDFWRVIEASSESDFDFYWSNARVEVVPGDDIDDAVRELTNRNRMWSAITVLSYGLQTDAADEDSSQPVAAGTVIAVLSAAIGEEPDPRDVSDMTGYYIGQLLDYLTSAGTELGPLARLEFAFFRLLEHTREPQALKRALAQDSDLFVDLVKRVYRGKNQPATDLTEAERQQATHAWWVLNGWNGFPGQQDDGTLDAGAMNTWVNSARLALSEVDRADIGDELIGQTFAHSPADADGVWPGMALREMIERIGSKELENGIAIGKRNAGGVVSRGVYDGGKLERSLASQYRTWSSATKGTWPRTSRILRELADAYERDARREDIEAEIDADRD
jgi:excisionase family DNA binding protein